MDKIRLLLLVVKCVCTDLKVCQHWPAFLALPLKNGLHGNCTRQVFLIMRLKKYRLTLLSEQKCCSFGGPDEVGKEGGGGEGAV